MAMLAGYTLPPLENRRSSAAAVSTKQDVSREAGRLRSLCRGYLDAAAAVSPGGKILNIKVGTFSPGLNGPGT